MGIGNIIVGFMGLSLLAAGAAILLGNAAYAFAIMGAGMMLGVVFDRLVRRQLVFANAKAIALREVVDVLERRRS